MILSSTDECVKEFRDSMSITSDEAYPDDCLETFEMYEGDGGVFFLGCNYCADCKSFPLGCNGEILHKLITTQEDYFAYINSSKFVKVVGYIE